MNGNKGLMLVLGVIIPTIAFGASFDCTKASSSVEKTICANPSLSTLDDQMSQAYKDARARSNDQDQLKQSQLEWIKSVRKCDTNSICIQNSYTARISLLRGGAEAGAKVVNPDETKLYNYFVTCYGQAKIGATYEPKNSKNYDTLRKTEIAFRMSAIEVGGKIGLSKESVLTQLSASANKVEKPMLLESHKDDPVKVKKATDDYMKYSDACQNEIKNNQSVKDVLFKNYNSIK